MAQKTWREILDERVTLDGANVTPNQALVYVDGLPYMFRRLTQKGMKGKIRCSSDCGWINNRQLFMHAFTKARDAMIQAAIDRKNAAPNRRRIEQNF